MDKHDLIANISKNIKYFYNKEIGKYSDYSLTILSWFFEIARRNKSIYESKESENDLEDVQRNRGNIYWIDFGVNVGSEFNFPHPCVVIREFKYTAIVVPLSTEKIDDAEWKSAENLIVKIGIIKNMKDNRLSYAMVNQMRSISKQRLNSINRNKKVVLNRIQMDSIDIAILSIIKNNTYLATSYDSDIY